jgi:murein DD-endopeptidase MepM/ murein hydrolase activator NlpD
MPGSVEPEELHMEWPVRGARITTWFAPTDRGFVVIDGQRVHNGLDLASFCGDWVRAAMDGTVVYAGRKFDPHIGYSEYPSKFYDRIGHNFSTLPVVIVLDHGNGYRTLYAHVRAKLLVEAGDTVKAGEIIGRESDTGRASGCHLHFELIRMDGEWMPVAQDLVDRLSYPPFMRPRIDPMRVLRFSQPGAGIRVRHYPPPKISPGYGPLPVFMEPVPPLTEPDDT